MEFKVKILGSNAASFAYGRHHTSQAVYADGEVYLIDCGEGTQIRMQAEQVRPGKLHNIFISHLHGDHCLGLPGLLSSLHLSGRKAPLTIYGPAGLDEWLTTYWRISGAVLSYPVFFKPIEPQPLALIHEDARVRVYTLPLDHRLPTTGFVFEEKIRSFALLRHTLPADVLPKELAALATGNNVYHPDGEIKYDYRNHTAAPRPARRYAYCSDTRPNPALIDLLDGVSLLYHEATFGDDGQDRAALTFHSTARQAAQIALQANAGHLLIGHFSSRYEDPYPLLDQAREVFGHTDLALEGLTFEVPLPTRVPAI